MRVTQRLYAAVGRTCHEWALLEDELRAIVICLSGSQSVQALVAGESGRGLVRTCRRLAPYARTLTEEAAPALYALLADCEVLADNRNTIAHSSWSRLSVEPDEYYATMSKYAPESRRSEVPNKRPLSFARSGRAQLNEVVAIADAIEGTRNRLQRFRFETFEYQPAVILLPRGWRLLPDAKSSGEW